MDKQNDINWGALDHASRASQLMSCNYYNMYVHVGMCNYYVQARACVCEVIKHVQLTVVDIQEIH